MSYRKLEELEDISGKQVLVRVDWNVPMRGEVVVDDFRIRATLPTIEYLKKKGASIILVSHRDAPPHTEEEAPDDSLKAVAEYFTEKFFPIVFVPDSDIQALEGKLAGIAPGDVVLIENIRRFKGEMAGDEKFGKELSRLGDIYVNEAFAESHRKYASITELPKHLSSYAGLRFDEEVKELSKAFNPPRSFVFLLGGSKFETKEPLIKKYLEKADLIFVGGALANDIFKSKGYEIGLSEHSNPGISSDLYDISYKSGKLILPVDVVVREGNGTRAVKKPEEVAKDDKILDAGPETILMLEKKIKDAGLVVWNGPLGQIEEEFLAGTEGLAKAVAASKGKTIVGGGDTLAAIKNLGIEENFSFVSTGGGAMLQFLAEETLPGIQALTK